MKHYCNALQRPICLIQMAWSGRCVSAPKGRALIANQQAGWLKKLVYKVLRKEL